MIDHEIVMVNAMNVRGNSSVVKFGGYDQNALKAGTSLTVLRTKDEKGYILKASEFKYDSTSLISGIPKDVDLNPQLPYMYVPDSDSTHVFYVIN